MEERPEMLAPRLDEVADAIAGAFPKLSPEEQRISIAIYRCLAQGRPARIGDIARQAQIAASQVETTIRPWYGIYYDDSGAVAGYWGLTLSKTRHRLRANGRDLYAWCAWDTLFIPMLLGSEAEVESGCPVSGERISLLVTRNGAKPANDASPVVSFVTPRQGAIEQVIDLQQDYNFTISRISQHKKLMTGKILTPKNANLSVKHDDVVGQIIYYAQGLKPTMEPAPPVPQYYFQEIARIREDMENMMNSHDASMGQTPGQVRSGIGITNLANRDEAQIAPELIMCEQKLGFFAESVLDIIQQNYTERRLLKISGEDLAFEIKSFIGSDLFGQKRVQIKMGSNFPLDKTERTQYILMLKNEGFISAEKAKELLEFTDIDGAFKSLDETAAKQDILNLIEGNMEVIAEPYEDHTIFLKVINDFMKGSIYARLPANVRQRILEWQAQHQEMLLREQRAAASMGTSLPPAAQPQQPQAG